MLSFCYVSPGHVRADRGKLVSAIIHDIVIEPVQPRDRLGKLLELFVAQHVIISLTLQMIKE